MRKEHNETEAIENYLFQRLSEEERMQFEAAMIVDTSLADKTEAQAGVYRLVRRFWRRQTRKKLERIYRQLMMDASFSRQFR
ncbi:MAG TPA: hypothetical protein VHK91_17335 [Flavisolibacter sp.]|nr:hypothetical protein [Flavisolibacter sp.]